MQYAIYHIIPHPGFGIQNYPERIYDMVYNLLGVIHLGVSYKTEALPLVIRVLFHITPNGPTSRSVLDIKFIDFKLGFDNC